MEFSGVAGDLEDRRGVRRRQHHVLKPSPYTPLRTLKLGEILRDILAAGILNIVPGGNDLGAQLTTHPDISKNQLHWFDGIARSWRRHPETWTGTGGTLPSIAAPIAAQRFAVRTKEMRVRSLRTFSRQQLRISLDGHLAARWQVYLLQK